MPRESESRPALTEGRMRHGVKPTTTTASEPPPPPPPIPPPKRVIREDAPGAQAIREFRERTIAWLRKYRIPVGPTNPYKALLAKWDEEIKRRQLEDSTHSMGTSIAMQEMADELRAVIDACEED